MAFMAGRRPSAAGVIAVGALVCALSGTAVASGSLQNGDKLIKKHSLSANRLRDHTVTGRQVKGLVWHDLTLVNGWAPRVSTSVYFEAPQYAKDALGFVHLRGTLLGTGKTAPTFAVAPPGFVSDSPHQWIAIGATDGSFGVEPANLDVSHDGSLAIYESTSGTYDFVSLDGAEYYAG